MTANLLDEWLRAYPASTRNAYARHIAGFLAHSKHDLLHATQDDVLAWHARLVEQAPATVNVKLAAVSSFYAYLRRRGIREDDPMLAIARRPKVRALQAARWLDADEQRSVLDAVPEDAPRAKRDRALLWVLAHGLRISEAVGLDVDSYRHNLLTFTGKGNKQRAVPVMRPAALALDAYIGKRKSGPLFVGTRGRISVTTARRVVWTYTQLALHKRMNPHSMRHAFAMRHLRAGTGLAQVGALLGHADTKTTGQYIHLQPQDLERAMAGDPLNETGELTVIEGGVRRAG
jgi:integrase/recombinase XerC